MVDPYLRSSSTISESTLNVILLLLLVHDLDVKFSVIVFGPLFEFSVSLSNSNSNYLFN